MSQAGLSGPVAAPLEHRDTQEVTALGELASVSDTRFSVQGYKLHASQAASGLAISLAAGNASDEDGAHGGSPYPRFSTPLKDVASETCEKALVSSLMPFPSASQFPRGRVATKAERKAKPAGARSSPYKNGNGSSSASRDLADRPTRVHPVASYVADGDSVVVTRLITPPRPLSPYSEDEDGRDKLGRARRDADVVHGEGSVDFEPTTSLESLLDMLPRALRSANVIASRRSLADAPDPDFPAAYSAADDSGSRKRVSPATCPPLPCALEALARTGGVPAVSKQTLLENTRYNIRVEGLFLKERPPPMPEPEILQCAPATATLRKKKPRPPTELAQEIDCHSMTVWNAALRSTGIASTIGVLAHHLKALVARPDGPMGERHGAALEAIGASSFQDALETSVGAAFAREVIGVADHIYHLAMDATYEHALQAISSTQARRLLWLDAMGVQGWDNWNPWLDRPVTLSDPGLFEGTSQMMDDLRRQQERQAALATMLRPAMPDSTGCTTSETPASGQPTGKARSRRRTRKRAEKPPGQVD